MMAGHYNYNNLCVVVVLLMLFFSHGRSFIQSIEDESAICKAYTKKCGMCGELIDVTLVVRNAVVQPTFDFNLTLRGHPQREFIHFLEEAARRDARFQFSVDFYSKWGYFITSVNKLKNDGDHYWMFSDVESGKHLKAGLSSHVPFHQQKILLNFGG